jgi:hypothetical protein
MTTEPSYLIRMSAARWQALADKARQIVPDGERPMTATKGSEWQRNASLRGWADGVYTMIRTDELEALRAKVERLEDEAQLLRGDN